jgi:dihydrofolate synthase/folylpolyglutamate synthase
MNTNSDIKPLLDYLFSLHRFGIKPGLERIQALLQHAGNPQNNYPCIHVAGTNGKGSVCSMIAAVLTAAGYKTGLYTSPHVRVFNERIRVNGAMIPDQDIARITAMLRQEADRSHTTFFEITTAMAFTWFAEQQVDIAIIETGMGGRLDSTNVIENPLLTIITSIDYDHMDYLGSTLQAIAGEKAGIFKKGCPAIIAEPREILYPVFEQHAIDRQAGPLFHVNKSYTAQNIRFRPDLSMQFDAIMPNGMLQQLHCERAGMHQVQNTLTAIYALNMISHRFPCTEDKLREGLKNTSVYTGLAGRIQMLPNKADKQIVLDVGHNQACLWKLRETLELCGRTGPWNIVFGVMNDKPAAEMLQILQPLCAYLHICAPAIDRSMPIQQIQEYAASYQCPVSIYSSVEQAIKKALAVEGPVLITGSFYLADEALQALEYYTA